MAAHKLNRLVWLSLALLLATMSPAEAGPASVGDVINSVGKSFEGLPGILGLIAYMTGLIFAISGVFKFKDHVDSPTQNPLSAGVKRFLAGGMLFSGPYVGNALYGSLFTSVGGQQIGNSGRHTAPSGGGMDQMIVDLISNVAGPMELLLTAFTYISAIALLLVGVVRLTKTAQEGPRGPTGMGTLMTFLASGALFSFGDMMGAFSTSLFGDATISTYVDITVIPVADAAKVAPVIEAVMAFIMIVGYIAFIRGWFVLKAFADGNSGVSLAQALTFLFGGAMAINMGELVNVLQKTVGVSGITFG